MTEETWILHQCRRPKRYGALGENNGSESNQSFIEYIVQPNDTLTSIAVKNDISVGQLRHFNRILLLGDKSVLPDTVLRIPLPQRSTTSTSKEIGETATKEVGQKPSISFSTSGDAERQHQLLLDPLVDAINSTSQSFHLDRPSSYSDHHPERL